MARYGDTRFGESRYGASIGPQVEIPREDILLEERRPFIMVNAWIADNERVDVT